MTSPSDPHTEADAARTLDEVDEALADLERREVNAIERYRVAAIALTRWPNTDNYDRSMVASEHLFNVQKALCDLYHRRKRLIDGVDRSPAGEDTDVTRATELFDAIMRRGAPGDEAHGSDPANFRPWAIGRLVTEFRRSRKG